ncbi:hypothetical protein [Hydrogenophaga sp.]|jgi:hypothetical protein|uniref:hypothetical protein n=1 Tax=Hydrogenophaga sp. TaxID=1904254 RepID=UPI00273577C3|nr:hypothetical protein [Hydrogenophaga sp.]MDP3887047.1 hypothetical protein [Hydrogenophaga sp.]
MSALVISLELPMAEADYRRPKLSWVKRRARRIQRFFKVSRSIAIAEAIDDYHAFAQMHRARLLTLIQGGRSHG